MAACQDGGWSGGMSLVKTVAGKGERFVSRHSKEATLIFMFASTKLYIAIRTHLGLIRAFVGNNLIMVHGERLGKSKPP